MMSRAVLVASLLALASSAHAAGLDLTSGACPGNPGATADGGSFDCVNGNVLEMILTFEPAEDIPQFISFDATFHGELAGGDLNSTATFWNAANDGPNAALLNVAFAPIGGFAVCGGYTRTFGAVTGSGLVAAMVVETPATFRIVAAGFLPAPRAVAQDEKLFGLAIDFDATSPSQREAPLTGCSQPVCITAQQVTPNRYDSASGRTEPMTTLTSAASFGTLVGFNGAAGTQCYAVPARRHTWGALKALYR